MQEFWHFITIRTSQNKTEKKHMFTLILGEILKFTLASTIALQNPDSLN